MLLRTALLAAALAAGLSSPAFAEIVVLDFEDHPGSNRLIADGYGGARWGGAFRTYDTAGEPPFMPHSGTTAAYFNYTDGGMKAGEGYTRSIFFDDAVTFLGAWFSGDPVHGASFEFYLDGAYLGSTSINVSGTPTFLAGIGMAVDEVRLSGGAGNFIMDDLSYDTALPVSAVPEPGAWALMILGFGAIGSALRRRRSSAGVLAGGAAG